MAHRSIIADIIARHEATARVGRRNKRTKLTQIWMDNMRNEEAAAAAAASPLKEVCIQRRLSDPGPKSPGLVITQEEADNDDPFQQILRDAKLYKRLVLTMALQRQPKESNGRGPEQAPRKRAHEAPHHGGG